MSRNGLTYLLAFFLLFSGLEGAVETAEARHLHDSGTPVQADAPSLEQTHLDDGDDDCTHCCHAHAGSLFTQSRKLTISTLGQRFFVYSHHLKNRAQGPPTPPPNV